MNVNSLLMMFFIVFCSFSCSGDIEKEYSVIKEKIRPWIVKTLGGDFSNKVLGKKPSSIVLPEIPKINMDAKSIEIYNVKNNEDKKNYFSSKKEMDKYNYLYINELFKVVRETSGSDDEISSWMNVMSQGGTREGVYRALVLDDVYAGLENYKNPLAESIIDFNTYYLDMFLGQSLSRDVLKKINHYTLKSVVVEKTLEVVDELSKNKSDLYDWYAVFSSELAGRYQNIWKNDKSTIRGDCSKGRHKKWAGSVPIQHLKSEIIIKLHKIYNSLK